LSVTTELLYSARKQLNTFVLKDTKYARLTLPGYNEREHSAYLVSVTHYVPLIRQRHMALYKCVFDQTLMLAI